MNAAPTNATPMTRRHLLGPGVSAAAVELAAGCSNGTSSSRSQAAGDNGDGRAGTLLEPPFEKPDVTLTILAQGNWT